MESPALLTKTPPAPVRRSRRTKIIGSIIAVLAMAGLGALAWHLTHPAATGGPGGPGGGGGGPGGPGGGRGGPGGGRGGPSTTVGVATAETMDIPITIDALGTVTAAATATVRPQVSGILTKINFSEGQLVKAGQVLAVVDPRPFEMALMQASGQRQRDEAQLDSARVTLERYRTLLTQDSIARQDVDTQAALVKQLEGTVMTDKANEGTAKLNLSFTQVKAPITGRVGLRVVDMGNLVGSGDANGIAVITQLSPIDVEFAIPQDQVPAVQQRQMEAGAAMPAVAYDRTRTTVLETGKFAALDNQVDVQTGTVKAKGRFANPKLVLFPSQFVNLRLELRTVKNAVVVPVTALRHGANGDFVYVLNAAERTVAIRPVVRGQATVDKVEIKTGLKTGEQVITEGADRLKDGAKVTLPGDKPAMGGAGGGRGGRRGQRGADGAAAGGGAPGGAPGASGAPSGTPGTLTPQPGVQPTVGAAPGDGTPPGGERRHRRDGAAPADGAGSASAPAAAPASAAAAPADAAAAGEHKRRWAEGASAPADGAAAGEHRRRRAEAAAAASSGAAK